MARMLWNVEKGRVKVVVLVDTEVLRGGERSIQRRRRVGQGEVESDVRYQTNKRWSVHEDDGAVRKLAASIRDENIP